MNNKLKLSLNTISLLFKISVAIGFLLVATVYVFYINYFSVSDYCILLKLMLFVSCAVFCIFISVFGCFILVPLNWVKLLSIPDIFFRRNQNNISILDDYFANKFDFNIKLRIIKRYIAYMSIYLIFTFTLKEKIIIYAKLKCFSSVSGSSLLIGISLITQLSQKSHLFYDIPNGYYYFIAISILVVYVSSRGLFLPKESTSHKNWMLMFGTVFIMVICFLNNLPFISSLIMSNFQLGNITSTFEIDNVACQALQEAHYPIKCNPKKQRYFLRNINVKWRSGEYYITFKTGGQTKELLIPQVHILAVLNPQINNHDKKS